MAFSAVPTSATLDTTALSYCVLHFCSFSPSVAMISESAAPIGMSTQKRAANGHDDDDRDDDADAFVAGVAADATFSDYKFVKQIGKGGYGVV